MRIPFVDLRAQYGSIKTEMDAAIAAVLNETAFIGGPHVKEFEAAFANYCGVRSALVSPTAPTRCTSRCGHSASALATK